MSGDTQKWEYDSHYALKGSEDDID